MGFALGNEVNENIITNKEVYGDVSSKYINTSTEDIITELNKYMPVKPVGFSASRVRKLDKENKQKHVIMLEPEDSAMPDGTNLRLVLFNSLDRSTSIRIYLGAYRNACDNNMVMGEDIMKPIRIKHTFQGWKDTIARVADEYQSAKYRSQQTIEQMMNTYLSYGQQGMLAEQIADILNSDITGHIIDPLQLNVAHRIEDVGKDAWHTYQRIQYNVMNGGIERAIKVDDEQTISKTHKVTDQQKQLKYNLFIYKTVKKCNDLLNR